MRMSVLKKSMVLVALLPVLSLLGADASESSLIARGSRGGEFGVGKGSQYGRTSGGDYGGDYRGYDGRGGQYRNEDRGRSYNEWQNDGYYGNDYYVVPVQQQYVPGQYQPSDQDNYNYYSN